MADDVGTFAQKLLAPRFGSDPLSWLPGGDPIHGKNGKKTGPTPPDFTGAAEQQASAQNAAVNAQTQANRANTSTGFGSTSAVQNPDGSWAIDNRLAPGLEQSNQLAQSQLANALRAGLPTGDQARQQAIDAAYGDATSRLDPQFAQREAAMRSQLANQGLDPTSEAYRTQMENFGRERNDAYGGAMRGAIGQGTAAGQAIFNQGLASQAAPLGLLGGLQGLGMQQPGYHAAGVGQAPDYLGALQTQYGGDLERWKTGMKGDADAMGGIMKFIGAMSDERLKTAIVREATGPHPGIPWASWEWKDRPGERFRGVIAQDVQKVAPKYVAAGPDGWLRVDYGGLLTDPEVRRAGR